MPFEREDRRLLEAVAGSQLREELTLGTIHSRLRAIDEKARVIGERIDDALDAAVATRAAIERLRIVRTRVRTQTAALAAALRIATR